MDQANADKKLGKADCLKQLFGGSSCSGECIYKWDPLAGHYVLQPGSSCAGGSSCSSCSQTQSAAVYGLALLLGKGCFADPQIITYNCGVDIEAVVAKAIKSIKLYKLLVRSVIGLGCVSVLSIAGAAYVYFSR